MLKSDLRENGYSEVLRNPKHSRINALWAILALILIAGTFILVYIIVGDNVVERRGAIDPIETFIEILASWFGGFGELMTMLFYFALLIYLAFKLIMTILVCQDKHRSIKLKILSIGKMPICHCKEALKVWQTILIYFVPVIIMYLSLIILCALSESNPVYTFILIFLSIFMAFDLTVIIYALIYKLFDGVDYISVDFHLYELTFFHKPYIRFNQKASKKFK